MALPRLRHHPASLPQLELAGPAALVTGATSPKLWLALVFPALPLAALDIPSTGRKPVVALESTDPGAAVCATTSGGRGKGIVAGQGIPAVLARVPTVKFVYRDRAAEARELVRLADWASRFTPTVSLQPPDALLLEMRGSLHLFGDAQRLRQCLHREFEEHDQQVCAAFAPTPRAALWFARAGREVCLDNSDSLHSALGDLPLQVLPGPPRWHDAFRRLGLATLRDLLRLPRTGLVRRFGPELLQTLDQALGRTPDPVTSWAAAPRYTSARALGFEARQAGPLLPVIDELLTGLESALRQHDAGIRRFEIRFMGYRGAVESLTIGTREVSCAKDHWMRLVHTHLETLHLTRPVETVMLQSGRFEPYLTDSTDFFAAHSRSALTLAQLLDTLYARLGTRGVAGLKTVSDRRPEKAWRWSTPGISGASWPAFPPRPCWLLTEPRALRVAGRRPVQDGQPLVLDAGPERIECGGLVSAEIRRDYYRAHTTHGERLWVYREISPPQHWFLQGYFA